MHLLGVVRLCLKLAQSDHYQKKERWFCKAVTKEALFPLSKFFATKTKVDKLVILASDHHHTWQWQIKVSNRANGHKARILLLFVPRKIKKFQVIFKRMFSFCYLWLPRFFEDGSWRVIRVSFEVFSGLVFAFEALWQPPSNVSRSNENRGFLASVDSGVGRIGRHHGNCVAVPRPQNGGILQNWNF